MTLDLSKIQKIHFSGIGGIGMSALARMMMHEGKTVVGSDTTESKITADLVRAGIPIKIGQVKENITPDIQLFVYTAALDDENPELMRVKEMGIPMLTYAETLGVVSAGKRTIAVAGTHGKTTTTAMIADVTRDAGLDPTVIVGSLLKESGSNYIAGKGLIFVIEACEYKKSFLNLRPWIGVITNIDNDHLDYYGDMEHLVEAFCDFARLIPENGYLVCNPNGANMQKVVKSARCRIVDYTLVQEELNLAVPGEHNILDAKASLAVANILNVSTPTAFGALNKFSGTWRRFEYKGATASGAFVYDDYGHHPTEIKATLQAAREKYPDRRIIVVFMPHLYSRTKLLLTDFGRSFGDADDVIVTNIFAAREPFDPAITSQMVVDEILKNGKKARWISDMNVIVQELKGSAGSGDVIVTIGAGDVYKVSDMLVAK